MCSWGATISNHRGDGTPAAGRFEVGHNQHVSLDGFASLRSLPAAARSHAGHLAFCRCEIVSEQKQKVVSLQTTVVSPDITKCLATNIQEADSAALFRVDRRGKEAIPESLPVRARLGCESDRRLKCSAPANRQQGAR